MSDIQKLQIAEFADAVENSADYKYRLVIDAILTQFQCLDLGNNEYQCPSKGICKDEGALCILN